MYHEKAPIDFNPSTGKFQSLMSAVLKDTSLFAFIWSNIRYLFIRWKLNKVLPKAGNIGLTS
ncbi:MAG TPA: hypothetical protein PK622_09655 [Saprospiraceae bacterium]|nr:hypothetical protein [Saprospiraceae bacterium]HUN17067.1 hypothetical protein [Saprospiraceae bacterium]